MPQSVEGIGYTTIALAIAMVLVTLYLRRYGDDDPTDTLVILWRRWALFGKTGPAKKGGKKKRKPARKRRPPARPMVALGTGPRPAAVKATPQRTKPQKTKPAVPEPVAIPEPPAIADPVTSPQDVVKGADLTGPLEPVVAEPVLASAGGNGSDASDDGDHIPLATAEEDRPKGEPKLMLRQRFRRGLRRTRERLGAELREAFTGGATPEAFDRIEEALIASDVGTATATGVTEQLRDRIGLSDKTLADAVKEVMVGELSEADRRLRLVRGRLSVWVVVGVNGTGKTTMVARLASRAKDLGVTVSLAAADTFRAAAIEQLDEWGRRIDVPVVKQSQGADPGAVVFDAIAHAKANGHRLLIVDTAGRLHTRKPLMDELQKVIRVIEREPDATIAECLLVIDATTGQNGISQAKVFKDAVSVTGLAIAKLDGTAKGGIAFAVEKELSVPVKAVGVGETAKDLVPFDPTAFVDALVGEGGEEESED